MTTATWLSDLIEERFDQSRDPVNGEGVIRDQLSERPNVIVAGDSGRRRRLASTNTPTIFITGENVSKEARSVGYRDKKVESRLAVEIVLDGDRARLFGTVGEDYGGYAGEVERIIDSVRVGPAPRDEPNVETAVYDYVEYDQLSDEVERYGSDRFGAEWSVTFINEAESILQ